MNISTIKEKYTQIAHLYCCLTDKQFLHIVNSQYKAFPARFFSKNTIHTTLDFEKVKQIASSKNNWKDKTKYIYIIRFIVNLAKVAKFANGDINNPNVYISFRPENLDTLNSNIIGYIEMLEKFELKD